MSRIHNKPFSPFLFAQLWCCNTISMYMNTFSHTIYRCVFQQNGICVALLLISTNICMNMGEREKKASYKNEIN